MRGRQGKRHALMQAKRCVSALRCRQPPASIASCPRRRQFVVARADQEGDPDSKQPGIWRMSGKASLKKEVDLVAIEVDKPDDVCVIERSRPPR
jgi:hypothetical protein